MQRKTASLLAEITKITKSAVFDGHNTNPATLQHLADFHWTLHALTRICEHYRQHLDPAKLQTQIKELLAARAARVVNTALCYTLAPFSTSNQICELLAKHCDAANYVALLLPEVSADDIFGNNINEIGIRNFMLTDDGKQFICFESIIETAFARMQADEKELFLTTDATGQQRSLTADEMTRLGNIGEKLLEIKANMNKESWWSWLFESSSNQFYKELLALREGLRRGDASHGGQELNAGADANAAIVRFRIYYEKLAPGKREEVNRIGAGRENLGTIFNLLFRDPTKAKDNNGMSVVYCLQIIGRDLDSSIANNKNTIKGISQSKQEAIESLKRQLLEDIKNRNDIRLGLGKVMTATEQNRMLLACINDTLIPLQDNYATCLQLFIDFTAAEIERRLQVNNNDEKCSRYTTILSRLVFEAAVTPCRSEQAKHDFVMNTFRSISQITAASSSKIIRIRTPESVSAWNKFLTENGILNLYPFLHNEKPTLIYISDIGPDAPHSLQLDVAYINCINRAEEAKYFEEWAAQHPYSAMFLSYSTPIINYVAGAAHEGNRLANAAYKNPARFFQQHQLEIAASAAIGVGAMLVLKSIL